MSRFVKNTLGTLLIISVVLLMSSDVIDRYLIPWILG